MKNNKGFAHLGMLVIIIILLAVVGYFLLARDSETIPTPTSSPTSTTSPEITVSPTPSDDSSTPTSAPTNTPTASPVSPTEGHFRSDKYVFEFTYPENYSVEEATVDSNLSKGLLVSIREPGYEPPQADGGHLPAFLNIFAEGVKPLETCAQRGGTESGSLFMGFEDRVVSKCLTQGLFEQGTGLWMTFGYADITYTVWADTDYLANQSVIDPILSSFMFTVDLRGTNY